MCLISISLLDFAVAKSKPFSSSQHGHARIELHVVAFTAPEQRYRLSSKPSSATMASQMQATVQCLWFTLLELSKRTCESADIETA